MKKKLKTLKMAAGILKKSTAVLLSALIAFGTAPDLRKPLKVKAGQKAEVQVKTVNLGTDALSTAGYAEGKWSSDEGKKVYFGQYEGSPLAYRVLKTDSQAGTMLLDCDTTLFSAFFDEDGTKNDGQQNKNSWKGSDLETRLNGNDFYNNTSVFSSKEKNAVALTELQGSQGEYQIGDYLFTDDTASDHIFLLSRKEVDTLYGVGGTKKKTRTGGNDKWWLRSAFVDRTYVDGGGTILTEDGYISIYDINMYAGVSPAFQLQLSDILFTSSSGIDKSSSLALTKDAESQKTWNLTLQDGTGFAAQRKAGETGSVEDGGKVTVNVSDIPQPSSGNAYTQISAMLVNEKTGVTEAYGKISDNVTTGEVEVTIPEGLGDGTFQLNVFAEDVNSNAEKNLTDYASNMAQIPVTVKNQERELTSKKIKDLTKEKTLTLNQDYYLGDDIFLQGGNPFLTMDLNGHSLRVPETFWLNVKESGLIKNGTLIVDKGTVNFETDTPISEDVSVVLRNGMLNAPAYTFTERNLEIENGMLSDASLGRFVIYGKAEINMLPGFITHDYRKPLYYNQDGKNPEGEQLLLKNVDVELYHNITVPNGKRLIIDTKDMKVTAQGRINVEAGGVLQILDHAVLKVENNGKIENKGEIDNQGEISNAGEIIDLGTFRGNEAQGNKIRRKYQLNLSNGNALAAGGSQGKQIKVLSGEKVTITADSLSGSKFVKWSAAPQVKFENEALAVTTFIMPDYDLTVSAEYKKLPVSVKVSKLTLNTKNKMVLKGKTYQLKASVSPSNAANKTVTWKSSNSKTVSVDSKGKVTAKNYGTASITATAADGSKKYAVCKITVPYRIKYQLNKGKNNKKNPSVYYNQTVTLKKPARKGYTFLGWYQTKNYKKKITKIKKGTKKNYTLYAKWKKVKVKAVKIKKIRRGKSGKIKISYSKSSGAGGYQIKYALNKKYKKAKYKTFKGTTATLNHMKRKKKYYFKVRAYKIDSAGKKVYSKYSGQKVFKN